jgi:hypothetical protein
LSSFSFLSYFINLPQRTRVHHDRSNKAEQQHGDYCVAYCKWYASMALFSTLGLAGVKGVL